MMQDLLTVFYILCTVVPGVTGLRVTGVSPNSITVAWEVGREPIIMLFSNSSIYPYCSRH